jgi:hypothetical protein
MSLSQREALKPAVLDQHDAIPDRVTSGISIARSMTIDALARPEIWRKPALNMAAQCDASSAFSSSLRLLFTLSLLSVFSDPPVFSYLSFTEIPRIPSNKIRSISSHFFRDGT